jgi:release factor glutamine methyltransferase
MPELTIKTLLTAGEAFLLRNGIENYQNEIELLLGFYLNVSTADLYLNHSQLVSESIVNNIRKALLQRGKRKPLQYIIGEVDFLNTVIKVNESVLIPRPETEYMVDYILKREVYRLSDKPKILDLCTGSGAIAITLKKNIPNAEVYASDICDYALQVCRVNANNNDCLIHVLRSNLLEELDCNKYDLIVSNPPYVSEDDYLKLEPEIHYEPRHALVSSEDGLYFYKRILKEVGNYLTKTGVLYLEIGYNQTKKIIDLAEKTGHKNLEIINDLAGKERVIRISY